MISLSKRKRTIQKYYVFFLACLWSFCGLVVYLLGKNFISFPRQWFFNPDKVPAGETKEPEKLFLLGIGIYSSVSWSLSYLFYLLNFNQKLDYTKVRQWKYWTNKILVFFFSVVVSLGKYWNQIGNNDWGDILLLGLIVMVVNCCLIDLLIQLMNQYGICSAFNLIFFTDYLPTKITGVKQNYHESLGWFFLTVLFIWITNLKWEVPVETNTLYSQDNKLVKKTTTRFGFKLNLSFMGFYQLSWIISWLGWIKTIWGEPGKTWRWFFKKLGKEVNNETFFFRLNKEEKTFFSFQKWKDAQSKSTRFFGIVSLILLRGLANWFQIRMQWNPQEISQDLQKSGIYFDNVPPGRATRKLLRKKINELILVWYLIILVSHFIFDNITSNLLSLSFINWFSSVNLGTNLIQQIRTKYKYIQINR